jgi:hypothetical protein
LLRLDLGLYLSLGRSISCGKYGGKDRQRNAYLSGSIHESAQPHQVIRCDEQNRAVWRRRQVRDGYVIASREFASSSFRKPRSGYPESISPNIAAQWIPGSALRAAPE